MAEPNSMWERLLRFNQMFFDNSFKVGLTVQEQNQKMLCHMMKQTAWIPEEGRKLTGEWMANHNKSCLEWKKAADQFFQTTVGNFEKPPQA